MLGSDVQNYEGITGAKNDHLVPRYMLLAGDARTSKS